MMKLLFLTAALLFSLAAAAQDSDGAYAPMKKRGEKTAAPASGQESATLFRNANMIVVTTSDSATVAFRKAGLALLDAGYAIERKENDLLYMLTAYRQIPNSNVRTAIRVVVSPVAGGGSKVAFTGTLANQMADMLVRGATQLTAPIANRSAAAVAGAWREMMRVASGYPAGKLSYRQTL